MHEIIITIIKAIIKQLKEVEEKNKPAKGVCAKQAVADAHVACCQLMAVNHTFLYACVCAFVFSDN